MTIRSHLVLLVCAALLPVLIFAAVLPGLFWLHQRAAFDQTYLERCRAMAIALDTEVGASIRVLESLALSAELDDDAARPERHRRRTHAERRPLDRRARFSGALSPRARADRGRVSQLRSRRPVLLHGAPPLAAVGMDDRDRRAGRGRRERAARNDVR